MKICDSGPWKFHKKLAAKIRIFRLSLLDQSFKKAHKIKSRKITKFVSRTYVHDETQKGVVVEEFLKNAKERFSHYSQSSNTDQSGFEREMRSKRALSFVGGNHTQTVAQSVSALSHSYTIMPTISMDGSLLPKLFIVLQEPKGFFGPVVSKRMFQAENIIVTTTKSGKMGKKELKQWFKEAFFPFVSENFALLLDSWTTYNVRTCIEDIPPGKTIELLQIPPGTTGKIQPLDKFFFRQWKAMYRRLSENIVSHKSISAKVSDRDTILQLQSFIHFQFSSPRFQNMIKYSWFATRYITERPPEFVVPVKYCLETVKNQCEEECDNEVFIRCAWSRKHLF